MTLPRTATLPVRLACALLLFAALLVALGIGIPAGILAAVKRNTWLDYIPMSVSMAGWRARILLRQ